jgi:hypothetical protein
MMEIPDLESLPTGTRNDSTVEFPPLLYILNHTSGSFGGVVGVYQRHSFADEKRQALETWAAFLDRLCGGADHVAKLGAYRRG